jgi:hypothetical protein
LKHFLPVPLAFYCFLSQFAVCFSFLSFSSLLVRLSRTPTHKIAATEKTYQGEINTNTINKWQTNSRLLACLALFCYEEILKCVKIQFLWRLLLLMLKPQVAKIV